MLLDWHHLTDGMNQYYEISHIQTDRQTDMENINFLLIHVIE